MRWKRYAPHAGSPADKSAPHSAHTNDTLIRCRRRSPVVVAAVVGVCSPHGARNQHYAEWPRTETLENGFFLNARSPLLRLCRRHSNFSLYSNRKCTQLRLSQFQCRRNDAGRVIELCSAHLVQSTDPFIHDSPDNSCF